MKKWQKILTLILLIAWIFIFIDCVVVGAREAIFLAGGMALTLTFIAILRKSKGFVRFLRRVLIAASSALHVYIVGVIVFLMVFAGAHIASGDMLGAFLLGNDLKNDQPGELYLSRIDTAEAYLKAYPDSIVIACGGLTGDNTVTEAQAAKNVLTKRGIDPDRILCEDSSIRTLDNFEFAAQMLERSFDWNRTMPTAVITNRFHFYRTSCLAQTVGYQTLTLIPADCRLPFELSWVIREVMTVTKFWVVGAN